MRIIGVILNQSVFNHWGNIRPNVILTDERILHILEGHQKDYEQYGCYIPEVIAAPDVILEDAKHVDTAMFIRHIQETNINVIVKVAYAGCNSDRESSVITMYQLNDKKKEKMIRKNVVVYKSET